MEVKKPYVQMPKPENDEAVTILIDLIEFFELLDRKPPPVYYAAKKYLEKQGVNIET